MAKTYKAAMPQTPKIGQATIIAANTALDGSGAIPTVITAGPDGMVLFGLEAHARATILATSVRIFMQESGSSTWTYLFDGLIEAHDVKPTTANDGKVVLIDRKTEADKIEIPAGAKIGAAIAAALAGGITVTAYGADY